MLSSCGTGTSVTNTNFTYETRTVTIQTATGEVAVTAEIADTDEKRTYGLMNRESLAANAGMLFVFDETDEHSFWMKDTLISLDIIFIDVNKAIVYIEESATPLSTDRIQASSESLYILEVNGGYCAANNVQIGDVVGF